MTNPAIAAIRELLDDSEDNPRCYIAAVLDNLPWDEMCLGANPTGFKPGCSCSDCMAARMEMHAAISAARATLLPGDATVEQCGKRGFGYACVLPKGHAGQHSAKPRAPTSPLLGSGSAKGDAT